MQFQELKELQLYLQDLRSRHEPSLGNYYAEASNGFRRKHDDRRKGHLSNASTATCVASLIAAGIWTAEHRWGKRSAGLANRLLKRRWESAELEKDNPFTAAFMLEAVTLLDGIAPPRPFPGRSARIRRAEGILQESLRTGAVRMKEYPPSAYLTQLAVRVLMLRKALGKRTRTNVESWAWAEIKNQLALLISESDAADVFQLAYSIILVSSLTSSDKATPEQAATLDVALRKFFDKQLVDGRWPRSRPMFHYPGAGSAFCFDYELLVQLLTASPALPEKLLKYLGPLSKAAYALRDTAFRIGTGMTSWSSGHHPQLKGPESWSTASVYHFVHALDRLVAEEVRRAIFRDLDALYRPPQAPLKSRGEFAKDFLDCNISVRRRRRSLKKSLFEKFVRPIAHGAEKVAGGGKLSPKAPVSAIFFGPPGTSKTEITKQVALYLRWPHLTIDPSHFMKKGMDQLQTEADRLLGMLALAERIVVLLDEIDEMVRARETAPELLSRFLTTSMLPRLAAINRTRKIIFIVATNYIKAFDIAIQRPGRFDMIVQIMPPTVNAKLRFRPDVETKFKKLGVPLDARTQTRLGELTFDEFVSFADDMQEIETGAKLRRLLLAAHDGCTLEKKDLISGKKWIYVCHEQEGEVRGL